MVNKEGGDAPPPRVLLEMEIDDATDVEVGADWQRADHLHEFCRWFCVGLPCLLRRPGRQSSPSSSRWPSSVPCVKAYRDYVQYKYKGGDYYQFLQRIGYAEDPDYVAKVRQIGRML